MKIVEIDDITKCYHKKIILNNISYSFEKNKCYLVVGLNGSGKSTLIKIIVKANHSQKGRVVIDGEVGYVPERFSFPERISLYNFLYDLGTIRQVPIDKLNDKINMYLSKWQITDMKDKKLSDLSKGTLQKTLIIQSLLHSPDIYVFDEPLNGLDIKSRKIFFSEIKELKKDALVIIATHYQRSYQKQADIILSIKKGEIYEKINQTSL